MVYRVEENRVRQLDMQGEVIRGDLEANYLLIKLADNGIEDRRWRLIELNGEPIEGRSDRHYVLFHPSKIGWKRRLIAMYCAIRTD